MISAFVIGQNVGGSMASQPSGTLNIMPWPNVHQNVETDFNPTIASPQIENGSFIHPFAIVIGDCHIGKMVLMAQHLFVEEMKGLQYTSVIILTFKMV